ncbi:MAG: hypothetical protein GY856_23210 [bacterium]|nr:hypothetical protein [bacterium]
MDKETRSSITLLAAMASCLLGALALPPDDVAALSRRLPDADSVTLRTSDAGIVFRPQDQFKKLILTVTGPFEYVFVQEIGPGEDAVFELDPAGTADGSYTWEVRSLPNLSRETLDTLRRARESGDDSAVRALMREGALPDQARTQGGGFRVVDGVIVLGGEPEERSPAKEGPRAGDVPLKGDYVINNDLIVDGSACVGFDCADGWTFSFTTIGMSEHNTRIKFDDTSYTASYPNNDWQLLANDSSNGGTEKFSIVDCGDNDSQGNCSGSTVFTVEAGADSHSLYVDDAGRVGFGTSTPVAELHVVDGNTPTLRLAQDGSSGFTAQTFDVAGNEANFFIRDATNGSKLPFRIKPGAPTSSLTILDTGYVGMGTWSPGDRLHVEAGGSETPGIRIVNTDVDNDGWAFRVVDVDEFRISKQSVSGSEFKLDASGNLTISGDITSGGTTHVPDYVFEPDYPLLPVSELAEFVARHRHLPGVPSAAQVEERGGVNMSRMQMRLLEKIEELTLYTLAQQQTIETQQEAMATLHETIDELRVRLTALERSGGSP